jgi:hypothetical protein
VARVLRGAEGRGGDGELGAVVADEAPVKLPGVASDEFRTASLYLLAAVAGSGAVTSEAKLPPSFVQRSASSVCVSASPEISRKVVRGSSSGAHSVPQRQQASSWRAIGARQ